MERELITIKMKICAFNIRAIGKMELNKHNLDKNQLSQLEKDPIILHNM